MYLYTDVETPFSTCKRTFNGRKFHRQKATAKVRRYIKRHKINQ